MNAPPASAARLTQPSAALAHAANSTHAANFVCLHVWRSTWFCRLHVDTHTLCIPHEVVAQRTTLLSPSNLQWCLLGLVAYLAPQ